MLIINKDSKHPASEAVSHSGGRLRQIREWERNPYRSRICMQEPRVCPLPGKSLDLSVQDDPPPPVTCLSGETSLEVGGLEVS